MQTCPDCQGTGTQEFYVLGLGITERRCANEDCTDGLVQR